MSPPAKTCASCGREFEWRRKWARDWDEVRYCSTACRRRGVSAADRDLEALVLDAVAAGGPVVVADLARSAGAGREEIKRAARRLAAAGRLEFLSGGRRVDPSRATGAVSLRRRAQ